MNDRDVFCRYCATLCAPATMLRCETTTPSLTGAAGSIQNRCHISVDDVWWMIC